MPKPSKLLSRSAVIAGLAFAASCSDSSTSPSVHDSASLNAAIAQTTYGDASTYSSARALTGLPGAASPTFDPSTCTYSSSDNGFTCPSKTVSGVTFGLKYYLYDANDVALDSYSATTTAKLRTVFDAVGSFTTGTGASAATVGLNHHSDMTLTGLLGTTRTLNGTSRDRDTVVTTNGGAEVRATLDATGTATNVVLPAAAGQYPASGMLATDLTGTTTSNNLSTTASLRGTLTFNGTNFATFTLSSGAGTTACIIDLSGSTAPRC